jgi:hypothetical protein
MEIELPITQLGRRNEHFHLLVSLRRPSGEAHGIVRATMEEEMANLDTGVSGHG